MDTIRQVILQEMNEGFYNRKHIDTKIRAAIEADADTQAKLQYGIKLIEAWMSKSYYASKRARLDQLAGMDIPAMVMDIFTGVAYCQRAELFTSVSAQIASRLKFSDKAEAITTVAEMLAVLCQTDAFDIGKEDKMASLMLVSTIPLPETLLEFIENSSYLPPMVCKPLEVTHNFSSGYLTHNDSLLLGQGNHHDGDLCLDTINIQNGVALKLDLEFLCKVEEEPTFELDTHEKAEQWQAFKKQSYGFYSLMEQQGNRFYLTHKVDKRGRSYSCGYHINTQGTSFKKAMLELADEEIITGVPT